MPPSSLVVKNGKSICLMDSTNATNKNVLLHNDNGSLSVNGSSLGTVNVNTFTKATLPLNNSLGNTILVSDGTLGNTPTMAYFHQGKWYRTFDNSLITDQTIDLFILAGQSNAHGYAHVSALDSSRQTQDGLFYTSWHQNTTNAETTQYYTDWATSLVAGSTHGRGTSSNLSGQTKFGPELGFVSRANNINLTTRPIGIIKYAVGASTLNAGTALSDWDTTATGNKEGDCWRGFQTALSDATNKLNANGYSWNLKGMIWWQGESGSSVSGLQTLLSEVRNLLGTTYNVPNSSQFPIVITKIGYGTDLTPVASADAYVGIVDADSFGHSGSNNHIGESSNPDTTGTGVNDMFEIGEAYADQMAQAITGSTNSSWTPSSITTRLWLDFDDPAVITQVGGYVTRIDDKSANTYTFTTPSASTVTAETSVQNGRNVLRFNNNTDYTNSTLTTFAPNTRHKWYFVLKTTNIDSSLDSWLSVIGGGEQHILMGLSGSQFKGKWYNLNGYNPDTSTADLNDSWNILSVEWDEVNDTATTWLNGTQQDTGTGSGTLGGNKNIKFNKYQQIGDSDWGEAIFTENLTQANSDKIEGYLAHKWGLFDQLPSNHPYKASAP
uniref:Sialate O-acetylesterase domain-containing protein n=1 Tax=viral metagenome TaxID=1070528 RepID=A0A6C0LIU9_9ZZZZ